MHRAPEDHRTRAEQKTWRMARTRHTWTPWRVCGKRGGQPKLPTLPRQHSQASDMA